VVLSSGVGEWLRSGSPLLAAVAAGDALLMASRQAASTLSSLLDAFLSSWMGVPVGRLMRLSTKG